jgi:hypothetical protein
MRVSKCYLQKWGLITKSEGVNIERILIKPKNQMVGSGSHLNYAIQENAHPTVDDNNSKLEFNRAW